MVECDGCSCTFQWFHFECVGITQAPEDNCDRPLPTEEWKSAARNVIAKLSRCELTARSQTSQENSLQRY